MSEKPTLPIEDGEFASFYGNATTSLQIDHKGRVFAHAQKGDGRVEIVILNEADDAQVVLRTLIKLAAERLALLEEYGLGIRHEVAHG